MSLTTRRPIQRHSGRPAAAWYDPWEAAQYMMLGAGKKPPGTSDMTDAKDPEWIELFLLHEGKYYHCHYCVEGGMVTVRSSKGSASTQIGGSSPEMLARLMLRESIEGGNADEYSSG